MKLTRFASLSLGLLLTTACGSSSNSDSDAFDIRTTQNAVSGATPLAIGGGWIVYLASEAFTGASGTDFNNDGDQSDDVACVVRISNRQETNLAVAARDAVVIDDEVYLAVVESDDGTDWNGVNALGDIVLLHWSQAANAVTLVDTIDPDVRTVAMLEVGGRLYYPSASTPTDPDRTSLALLEPSAPTTPVFVRNVIGGGPLRPILAGEAEGLLVLVLDEDEEGVDLNGDADVLDGSVLALLDGTDRNARLQNVGLALEDEDAAVAAEPTGSGDWLVGFLVSEAAQGATNLNDPTAFNQPLVPDSCQATPDTDTDDQVLHFLEYQAFVAGTATAENTGLAGDQRVVVVDGYVATLSDEFDASCDLNEDGDTDDDIARWVAAVTPITPPRDPSQMFAVEDSLPGGAMGFATLQDRFVIVVDEADQGADLDGKTEDHDLVAWLDPDAGFSADWTFAHQSSSSVTTGTGIFDTNGNSEPYAGASWMAEERFGRLPLAFQEEVPGTNADVGPLNNNVACAFELKDNDVTDSLPVWADFESGPILDFDGLGFALDEDDAGIVIAAGFAFFRVDEAADGRDYNADGAVDDVVLMRNPLLSCDPRVMATSSGIAGPVIVTDDENGAAFLSSEFQAGMDFNEDGDTNDLVVRYFRF